MKNRSVPFFYKEERLINLCAHIGADAERVEEIKKIIKEDLDWNYFLEKVIRERVSSLVYKTVLKIDRIENIIPKEIFDGLKKAYYNTLSENMIRWKGLENMLNCFNGEGIKTIVFKGPALAESVYKDIGLRPMCDVDILVKEGDLVEADEALRQLGYNPPSYIIRDFSEFSANPYRNSVMYTNKDAGLKSVHLFWHIINLFPYHIDVFRNVDMDKIWNEACPLTLANQSTLTFSIYHEILYLSMHAFTHSFGELILLCDINEILEADGDTIDWMRLAEEAVSFGLSKYAYYTFYVCKELLGSRIPNFALERMRPEKISLFERRFIKSALERKSVSHNDILSSFGMNESMSARIRFLKGLLFPPKDMLPLIRQEEAGIFDYLKRMKGAVSTSTRIFRDIVLSRKKGTGYFFL